MSTEKVKGVLLFVINLVVNGGVIAFVPVEYKAVSLLVVNLIQVVYAYLDPTYTIAKLGMSESEYLGALKRNENS